MRTIPPTYHSGFQSYHNAVELGDIFPEMYADIENLGFENGSFLGINLNGLSGNEQVEIQADNVFDYLLKTRTAIVNTQSQTGIIQNNTQMLQMLDYLIKNWNTEQRDNALEILSKQEKELFKKGFISYNATDLEISDIANSNENGFFTTLRNLFVWEDDHAFNGYGDIPEDPAFDYEYYTELAGEDIDEEEPNEDEELGTWEVEDEIDGFGRVTRRSTKKKDKLLKKTAKKTAKKTKKILRRKKIKNVVQKTKKTIKKVGKGAVKVLRKVNKYNPATLVLRNSVRGLLALNLFGISTILNKGFSGDAKANSVLKRVEKMYLNLGGKVDKLHQSIKNGSKRTPVFNKKVKGINGLGSLTIASMIASGGAFIATIWSWIKKAGLAVVKVTKKVSPGIKKFVDKRREQKNKTVSDNSSDAQNEAQTDEQLPEQSNVDEQLPEQTTSEDQQLSTSSDFENIGEGNADSPNSDDKKEKRKKIIKYGLIGLGSVAVIGGGAYFLTRNKQTKISNNRKQMPKRLSGIELL